MTKEPTDSTDRPQQDNPPAGKRKPRRPAPENKQYTPPENKAEVREDADETGFSEDDDYARDVD